MATAECRRAALDWTEERGGGCRLFWALGLEKRENGTAQWPTQRRGPMTQGEVFWKLETGNWKLETGDWRLETLRLETGKTALFCIVFCAQLGCVSVSGCRCFVSVMIAIGLVLSALVQVAK